MSANPSGPTKIYPSGVSLKRALKMLLRNVVFRFVGHPIQKLWPDFFVGDFPLVRGVRGDWLNKFFGNFSALAIKNDIRDVGSTADFSDFTVFI